MGLKDFFQSRPLTNHLNDRIELCFSRYGPTLALAGTLTDLKKPLCINNISLSIQQDQRQLDFNWLAFRPLTFSQKELLGGDSRSPSKFVVSPGSEHPYHILFSDNNAYAEMKDTLETLRTGWEFALTQAGEEADPAEIFQDFRQQPSTQEYARILAGFCYWKSGDYELTVNVEARELEAPHRSQKIFRVNEDHTRELLGNLDELVADVCGRPNTDYTLLLLPLE
ncbi:MAG: hypothetical protein ACLFPX_05065 [Candidatus Omnitrophota bacterium]